MYTCSEAKPFFKQNFTLNSIIGNGLEEVGTWSWVGLGTSATHRNYRVCDHRQDGLDYPSFLNGKLGPLPNVLWPGHLWVQTMPFPSNCTSQAACLLLEFFSAHPRLGGSHCRRLLGLGSQCAEVPQEYPGEGPTQGDLGLEVLQPPVKQLFFFPSSN